MNVNARHISIDLLLPWVLLAHTCCAPTVFGDVLLLRNGEVLDGQLEQYEDYVAVGVGGKQTKKSGRHPVGRLIVDRQDIALRAHTKSDLYRRLRHELNHKKLTSCGTICSKMDLAEWCLRNELLDECEEVLASLTGHETGNNVVGLATRLEQARSPRNHASISRPNTADENRHVKMDELLPKAVVAEFRRFVQPILLNACSRCHTSAQQSEFVLRRPRRGQRADTRLTQANLLSVLGAIESEQLLPACAGPHGRATQDHRASSGDPPISNPAHLQRMENWVGKVASHHSTSVLGSSALEERDEPDPFDPAEFNSGHSRVPTEEVIELTRGQR